MELLVAEYENFITKLPTLIKKSKFKTDFFISEVGLARATFYRKLQEQRFSIKEVKKISKLLELETDIEQMLRNSEAEIRNDELVNRRTLLDQ